MITNEERRGAKRIHFLWPLWFGYENDGEFFRGQIYDLSRTGVSFLISQEHCPQPGRRLLVRFSYPLPQADNFEMGSYFAAAQVVRVEQVGTGFSKVALQLQEQLAQGPQAAENLGQAEELLLEAV